MGMKQGLHLSKQRLDSIRRKNNTKELSRSSDSMDNVMGSNFASNDILML